MKTTICKFAMLLLAMLIAMPSEINAAKEKKEKKPYEWNWDKKLSGNEGVDDYLLAVDSIWYQMKELNEAMERYTYKEDTIMVNGQLYIAAHMENSKGEYITRGTVNWQFAQTTMLSANIVLSATQVALQTATATMSLPSLGMGALTYGKYVKAGPKILGMATTGVRDIWKTAVQNAKRWNRMKAENVDAGKIWNDMTDKQKELLGKCVYIREVKKELNREDEAFKKLSDEAFTELLEERTKEYNDIKSNKSDEELTKAGEEFFAKADEVKAMPEDATKTLEEACDDDATLEKVLENSNKDQSMILTNRYDRYVIAKHFVNAPKLLLWARRPTTVTEEVEGQDMFA